MKKIVARAREYTKQDLAWVFVWMSAVYQFSFATSHPEVFSDQITLFYAMGGLAAFSPYLWGALGVIFLIFLFVGVYTRSSWMVRTAACVQAVLWAFAFIAYVMAGTVILALGVALTQVLFWAWAYARREYE